MAAGGAIAGVGLLLKAVVGPASDAQQSIGATETVFGKFAGTVIKSSDQAASKFGLSANAYRESANLIGSLFKNQGVATDQLAGKTDQMIGLGSDLAATFGGTTSDAVEALGSAFKGEFDTLERYGVSLKESTVSALLAKRGQDDLTGSALNLAKQQAVTDLIMRQSTDSLGAFGKESDTFAGQQQRMGAQFENLKASIGSAFLPVLTAGMTALNGLFSSLGPAVAGLKSLLAPVTADFSRFAQTLDFGGAGGAGVQSFAVSLVGAFNSVRSAIGGLIGAFAPFIVAVLPSLMNAGARIAATLLPAIQSIATVISTQLVPTFQRILPVLAPIVSFLVGVFASAVVGAIKGVVQAITGIVNVIAGVVNTVSALIHGDWAGVWKGLSQIVRGAVNAVLGIVRAWLNIGILSIFKGGVVRLLGSWRSLWTGIKNIGTTGASVIRGVISAVLNAIRALFTSAVKTYVNMWRTLFSSLRSLASAGWAFIRGLFSSAMGAIRGAVSAGMNAVRSVFSAAWNAVKSATSAAFNAIKTAVSNGVSAVLDLLQSIPGRAVSALGNLGSSLFNAGAELIQGLINGITSKISAVTDKMSDLASKVKGFLPGSPIKEGPLKAWNNTGPNGPGGLLVGMLAAGMANTAPIDAAMNRLSSRVAVQASPRLAFDPQATSARSAGNGGAALVHIDQMVTHDPAAAGRALRREQEKALALAGMP